MSKLGIKPNSTVTPSVPTSLNVFTSSGLLFKTLDKWAIVLSNTLKPITFTISEQGNYDVAEKPSNTLNNEKKLIKILVDNISTQVVDNLIARVNEL